MPLNTKQKKYAIIGGVSLLAFAAYVYLRKPKQSSESSRVSYQDAIDYAPNVPDYLYYNIGSAGIPDLGGNRSGGTGGMSFGDINIGGNNTFQPCKQIFMPMPTPTYNTVIDIPTIDISTTVDHPQIERVVLEPYDKYKCDIKTVKGDLDAIATLSGVPIDKIFSDNLYIGTSPHMGTQKQQVWEEGEYALATNQSKGWVSNYYDPNSGAVVYGRKVRYTLGMACECKKGNTDYCGQYLSPDYFESAHGL